MRCLCFSLLMSKRCIIAWNDNKIFWKCCLLFAYSVCKDMQNRNNHNPIAWICAINQPSKQSIKQSSNQRWQIVSQHAIKRWIQTNKKLSNQTINQPVQQPSKQSRCSHPKEWVNSSIRQAMQVVRCSFLCILSLLPFWLVIFRVSLLKYQVLGCLHPCNGNHRDFCGATQLQVWVKNWRWGTERP